MAAAFGETNAEDKPKPFSASGSIPAGFELPTGCGRPGSKSLPPLGGRGRSLAGNMSRKGRALVSKCTGRLSSARWSVDCAGSWELPWPSIEGGKNMAAQKITSAKKAKLFVIFPPKVVRLAPASCEGC